MIVIFNPMDQWIVQQQGAATRPTKCKRNHGPDDMLRLEQQTGRLDDMLLTRNNCANPHYFCIECVVYVACLLLRCSLAAEYYVFGRPFLLWPHAFVDSLLLVAICRHVLRVFVG